MGFELSLDMNKVLTENTIFETYLSLKLYG